MTTIWPLWAFAIVASFTPGAATVLVIASGARFGFMRSLPLVLGLASGLSLLGCLVGSGIGAALLVLSSVQDMLRVLGSAYLLWLAGRIARTGPPGGGTAAPGGVQLGLLLTLQNPKAWAVTLSAAASFSGVAEGPAGLALLLGSSFGVCAVLALSFWCVAGQEIGRRLRGRQQWAIVNGALGALLAASIIPIWL